MSNSPSTTEPSFQFSAVTASDTAVLTYQGEAKRSRAIYVGSISGGATMTIKDDAGTNVLFSGLVAGSVIPVSTTQIMATGTLASGFVVLF